MGKFNEELVKAGVMLAGEGLQPSSKGKRVHFSGTSRTVIDGPFTETKELIAGFWLWQVKSMDEAVEWARRCPNPMLVDSDLEIRPVCLDPDDYYFRGRCKRRSMPFRRSHVDPRSQGLRLAAVFQLASGKQDHRDQQNGRGKDQRDVRRD